MTISRRGFIAGLALTGAAVPAVYYAHREWKKPEFPVTPGEATVDLPETAGRQLADKLRGVWQIRFADGDAGIDGLPREGLELFLDIAQRGRGLRGYLDTAQNLRNNSIEPRYQLIGELVQADGGKLSWRMTRSDSVSGDPEYECLAILDEVWAEFGNAGRATLSVKLLHMDQPLALPVKGNGFVALKQLFPEARERIPLHPDLLAGLVNPEHRLFHQLWHASRDKWHKLSEDKRNALRGLGWQPGPREKERDARGEQKDRNGSGIDFFFMHRHMLGEARKFQALPSWRRFPLTQPDVERDRAGFAAYFDNHDGFSVPPTWLADDDAEYTQWVSDIKNAEAYHSNFEVWESRYRDPRYLSKLTLGQFGSEMELGLHDWLHMRWATVPRDPSNGGPVPMARDQADFAPRWFEPENDFLGDPFSSHVNPVFWHFHGWIDDRIEDWFRAHERFHPGMVQRMQVKGVNWFAPGRYVEVADPWLGPSTHGCSTTPGLMPGKTVEMDPEVMKLALRITFGEDKSISDLLRRVPQRPWYARHLKLGGG